MANSPLVMTVPMKERGGDYEGEGIVGYLMPDADQLSGTEDMHDMDLDMDLDASAMDQDGERPGEGSLCDSGK